MNQYHNVIREGDALDVLTSLPDAFVQVCVTSPAYYGLRSYLPEGHPDKSLEIGREETPEHYIERLVAVFREVKRVLRPDGTLWVNVGDSYAGGGAIDPYRRTTSGKLMPPQGRGRVSKGISYRLRANLTPEQHAYVLSELAKARSISEETQEGRS